MIIKTRDFGEEEISEEVIIDFPNGVYAFEENKRFVLLSPCGEDKYPMWLQSVDNPNLCFIVFDPREFVSDYSVELDKETKELLKADGAELDLLCMAVVPDQPQKSDRDKFRNEKRRSGHRCGKLSAEVPCF